MTPLQKGQPRTQGLERVGPDAVWDITIYSYIYVYFALRSYESPRAGLA